MVYTVLHKVLDYHRFFVRITFEVYIEVVAVTVFTYTVVISLTKRQWKRNSIYLGRFVYSIHGIFC